MQAAVFTGTNRPLELETLEVEEPHAGEVRVRMLASGVCHSDLHVVEGEWPEDPPIVLGHEGFGEVEAVGDGVASVAAGDRACCPGTRRAACARAASRAGRGSASARASDDHLMSDGTARLRRSGGEPVRSYLGGRVVRRAGRGLRRRGGAGAGRAAGRRRRADRLRRHHRRWRGGQHRSRPSPARPRWSSAAAASGCPWCSGSRWPAPTRSSPSTCTTRSWTWRATWARPTPCAAATAPAAEVAAIIPGGPDHVFEAIGLVPTIEWGLSIMPKGGTLTLVGMTPSGAARADRPARLLVGRQDAARLYVRLVASRARTSPGWRGCTWPGACRSTA